VQLRLPFHNPAVGPADRARTVLVVGRRTVTVWCVRHPRARRYLLRVQEDGSVRVTLPRRGSRAEALRFVRDKAGWIERERYRLAIERAAAAWLNPQQALLDGQWVELSTAGPPAGTLRLAGRETRVPGEGARAIVQAARRLLREHAEATLPDRLRSLAAAHGFDVRRVTVRDQRTRWGSCSASGAIALNWRLVQMPPAVRDYVLLHELAHLRHPDHSRRFWREVDRLCPSHREARRWLGEHGARAVSVEGPA
jgi:predicted metal-dependent hydrolase